MGLIKHYEITRGTTVQIPFSFLDDYVFEDFADIVFAVRSSYPDLDTLDDSDALFVGTKSGGEVSGGGKQGLVTIPALTVKGWAPPLYWGAKTVLAGSPNIIHPLGYGQIEIIRDIPRGQPPTP